MKKQKTAKQEIELLKKELKRLNKRIDNLRDESEKCDMLLGEHIVILRKETDVFKLKSYKAHNKLLEYIEGIIEIIKR